MTSDKDTRQILSPQTQLDAKPDRAEPGLDCPDSLLSPADREALKLAREILELEQALPDRVVAFCRNYAANPVGADAARQAGYSARSSRQRAHELRKQPDVQKLIRLYTAQAEMRSGISAERVRRALWSSYVACMAIGEDGKPANAPAAAKFLELMMKQDKLLEPSSRASASAVQVVIQTGLPQRDDPAGSIDAQAVDQGVTAVIRPYPPEADDEGE